MEDGDQIIQPINLSTWEGKPSSRTIILSPSPTLSSLPVKEEQPKTKRKSKKNQTNRSKTIKRERKKDLEKTTTLTPTKKDPPSNPATATDTSRGRDPNPEKPTLSNTPSSHHLEANTDKPASNSSLSNKSSKSRSPPPSISRNHHPYHPTDPVQTPPATSSTSKLNKSNKPRKNQSRQKLTQNQLSTSPDINKTDPTTPVARNTIDTPITVKNHISLDISLEGPTSDEIRYTLDNSSLSDFILDNDPMEASSEYQSSSFDHSTTNTGASFYKTGQETSESTSESSYTTNSAEIHLKSKKNHMNIKDPPTGYLPPPKTITHTASSPQLKEKSVTKSISKLSLSPHVMVNKPGGLSPAHSHHHSQYNLESPAVVEEVTITAPTLISHVRCQNTNIFTTNRKLDLIQIKTLNKNSVPQLPFTSWEEDGALCPTKNKPAAVGLLFGGNEKNSSSGKKSKYLKNQL